MSSVLPSMLREKRLISDKMSMSFSLCEGNKFHKTSHIVIGLVPLPCLTQVKPCNVRYWPIVLIKAWTFLNFNSRSFLVCSLRAMTVLWAVVCCVNACFCDSITLTASVLHEISHGQILYWFNHFWKLQGKDVFYWSPVNLTYPLNVQHKFCKSFLFRHHFICSPAA
jgi:hypothetical protein